MTNVNLRFEYQSKNLREDLSPTIVITSDTNVVVQSSTTMTHKGSGIYVYDYTASSRGFYVGRMTDSTEGRTISDMQFADVITNASSGASSVSGYYATTLELNEFMNMYGSVPNLDDNTSNPVKETISTVSSSGQTFYLNNRYIVDGSYNIYYGTAESTATALIDVTDYSLNLDTGKINLTATGEAKTLTDGTNTLYSEYSYNRLGFKNSFLRTTLDRAQTEIDRDLDTHFATSSDTTPDWGIATDEISAGRGLIERSGYYSRKYPIPVIVTQISSMVTADDTTINVDSTDGFPSSGYISIGTDKIGYTGKTSTTFTGCTSVSAHSVDNNVFPYVIEISSTISGDSPSWTVMELGVNADIDYKTGNIYLHDRYIDSTTSVIGFSQYPRRFIPNRVRLNYIYGYSEIPNDINKATLMLASYDLIKLAVRKAHTSGLNNFNPDLIAVDKQEFDEIMNKYRSYKFNPI